MDMELNWKIDQRRFAVESAVAMSDLSRRCAALEAACRYEVEQHARTRSMLSASALTLESWLASGAQAEAKVAVQEKVISAQAGQIAQLRAQLDRAAADVNRLASAGPAENPNSIRAVTELDGDEFTVDFFWDHHHQVVESIDSVWIGDRNVTPFLDRQTISSLQVALQEQHEEVAA